MTGRPTKFLAHEAHKPLPPRMVGVCANCVLGHFLATETFTISC